MTIETDETKGIARPFFILAHRRTGGTFCAHALSNHPRIFCDRGEAMHHRSVWRERSKMKPGEILRFIWAQTGYHAAGFRLMLDQALSRRVWPAIVAVQPHIIHLRRHSLVRQGLSLAYMRRVRAGVIDYHPVHSFKERKAVPIDLPPVAAVKNVARAKAEVERWQTVKYGGPVFDVYYEDMIGDTPSSATKMARDVGDKICRFLGVKPLAMRVDLKRDFPMPTPEMFNNWGAIERALRKAGYGAEVDYELDYWRRIHE